MKKNKKIIIIAVVALVLWLLYKRSTGMPVNMSSIAGGTSSNSTGTGTASGKTLLQKYYDEVDRWTAAAGGDADLGAYYFWQQGVNSSSPLSATDKSLVRWVREIMNTPDWKASTQQKASVNGVAFDTQIAAEAQYQLQNEGEAPYPN